MTGRRLLMKGPEGLATDWTGYLFKDETKRHHVEKGQVVNMV